MTHTMTHSNLKKGREDLKFIQEVDVQPLDDISDDIRMQIMKQLTHR